MAATLKKAKSMWTLLSYHECQEESAACSAAFRLFCVPLQSPTCIMRPSHVTPGVHGHGQCENMVYHLDSTKWLQFLMVQVWPIEPLHEAGYSFHYRRLADSQGAVDEAS